MGRGKIEIRKIENTTNRQVTYSKRRNGLFKKAHELTVLCDATVSIIILSSNNKLHEYISPSVNTKKIYDQYQKTSGIDIWSTHYDKMQANLRKLKDINNQLRKEIGYRTGQNTPDGLSYAELRGLEQNMQCTVDAVRARKYHVLKTQANTRGKKVKSLEKNHGNMLLQFETTLDEPHYGLMDKDGVGYESAVALTQGASTLYDLRVHPVGRINHPFYDFKGHPVGHVNLHSGDDEYEVVPDLRLN